MNGKVIVPAVFCALVVLVQSAVFSPFHEGNLLALKQAVVVNTTCADGYLVEFTSSGQIVQEVMLTTDSANDCKLFTDDYYGRITLSTDGARVILPCCHPDPSNETQYLVSFAIINSNGTMERTDIIQNSSYKQVVNAALNGNDIWYSQAGHLYHVINAPGNTAATEIFEQDFFQVQIYNGNLLVGNYDYLPHTIVQVGSGLPTELISGNGTAYLDTNITLSVNAFEFIDTYLVLNMYPKGINIYNLTSQELAYSVVETDEVGQLVSLLDQGKIIAHVHSIENTPASIYSFPFSFAEGIGSLSDATILLTSNATEEFMFKYYSPVHVPQGIYVPPATPTSSPTAPTSAPNTSGPFAAPTGKTPTGKTPSKASNAIVLVPSLSLLFLSLL